MAILGIPVITVYGETPVSTFLQIGDEMDSRYDSIKNVENSGWRSHVSEGILCRVCRQTALLSK
jgi:hypothetical protein